QVRVRLPRTEGALDVIEAGYDAGLGTGGRLDGNPALIDHPLMPNTLALCAAPSYVERHGAAHRPDDLVRHTYIALPADQHASTWRFVDPDPFTHVVWLQPGYTDNSASMLPAATLAGTGISVLQESYIAHAVGSGELVRILADNRIDDPHTQ
ncbi:LysR substrate-binding domain-containing protein, partial [Burkholderia pseudomallei]|uniref:LysR substrate-binding domain-containing protein n=1 Tax=Burkholderia pseudomallei TaxID=28450 RepID=UPI00406D31B5